MNPKIAIVIPRASRELVGGAENYAYVMGDCLSQKYHIELLTTTANDSMTWRNHYSEGTECISANFVIKRFRIDSERNDEFWRLNAELHQNISLEKYYKLSPKRKYNFIRSMQKTSISYCENWIKLQGPNSTKLLRYLEDSQKDYQIIVFVGYLYSTTYFGIEKVPRNPNVILLPTYHDEAAVYLPIYQKYKNIFHLFLTKTEKIFAEREVFKAPMKSVVMGFGIKDMEKTVTKNQDDKKFFLYAGRLEKGKGVPELFGSFEKYCQCNSDIFLYCIGKGELQNYNSPNIVCKGFVDEKTKLKLIYNSVALIQPSAYESLSIVVLESFMLGKPVIVNARSKVLKEHIQNSFAGFYYWNEKELVFFMERILNNKNLSSSFSYNARQYYIDNYSRESFQKRLFIFFDGIFSSLSSQNSVF